MTLLSDPVAPVLRVVVGTAGHIDHGKSSLVEQLTGTHPSRLKEEQERGMTIDIGYAEYPVSERLTAGIIDVPGHEKFIRNMVAGSSGVDLVMLVVAADDGVMPQTREHLQIMRLLGIRRGFTVITKIDMVDEDMLELVMDDVSEYLGDTFLADSPMIPVSNATGQGIDDVKATLARELETVKPQAAGGVFRMPVQRSFAVEGFGTVVTGVPVTGEVRVGDELEILPGKRKVRVRGLQVHHEKADVAHAGHRAALNITDVGYREVDRGDVVAVRDFYSAASLLEARLECLEHLDFPIRNDIPIRFHLGTSDIGGRVTLLDKKIILPGESGLIQLKLEEPVVVTAGDRYILRLASPMITIGGGVIVAETKWNLKRFRSWLTDNIEQKEKHLEDPRGYVDYLVRSQGTRLISEAEIAILAKRSVDDLRGDLDGLRNDRRLVWSGKERGWIHAEMLERAVEEAGEALLSLHERDGLQAGFHAATIGKEARLPAAVVEMVVDRQVERNKFDRLMGHLVRHRKFKGGLSNEDAKLVQKIEAMHKERPFSAPIYSEIGEEIGKPKKKVKELMNYLGQMGLVVTITSDLALHITAVADAEKKLVHRILADGPMPSNEFKTIIESTRKYVIPLLEHFDKKGVTKRDGNERKLATGWEKLVYESTLASE